MSRRASDRGGGAGTRPADTWTTDSRRAARGLGAVALIMGFGEELSVAALAAPIITVALVVLLLLLVVELRAWRRWSLR